MPGLDNDCFDRTFADTPQAKDILGHCPVSPKGPDEAIREVPSTVQEDYVRDLQQIYVRRI